MARVLPGAHLRPPPATPYAIAPRCHALTLLSVGHGSPWHIAADALVGGPLASSAIGQMAASDLVHHAQNLRVVIDGSRRRRRLPSVGNGRIREWVSRMVSNAFRRTVPSGRAQVVGDLPMRSAPWCCRLPGIDRARTPPSSCAASVHTHFHGSPAFLPASAPGLGPLGSDTTTSCEVESRRSLTGSDTAMVRRHCHCACAAPGGRRVRQ